MTLTKNLILMTDSYKASHYLQWPANMSYNHSYLSSRGGRFDKTIWAGLQPLIKEYFLTPITAENVEEAKTFFELHGVSFNYEGWMKVVNKHNGLLPIRIRAVKEGLLVPTNNVLMTVESTDPELAWIVGWLEPLFVRLWYFVTVCTQSWHIKQIIKNALEKSSDNPEVELPFKLHDFGARGCSSSESAEIGGMAHLINFMGSDTVEGIRAANYYYKHSMAAFSIDASEHATITSWGRRHELEAYKNMVKQFAKPGKIFACVSDSYDLFNAIEKYWCGDLKNEIEKSGATCVIRPDSGDPATIVLKCLQLLEEKVGMSINSKGYKVLPNYFRVIQGDGINMESIQEILNLIMSHGYSATNLAFGMGGALLQKDLDRDTQKFAYKCSEVVVNGERVPVMKDPITDPGKKSISGRLDLIQKNEIISTIQIEDTTKFNELSLMSIVYENGKLIKEYTLEEVRKNSNYF